MQIILTIKIISLSFFFLSFLCSFSAYSDFSAIIIIIITKNGFHYYLWKLFGVWGSWLLNNDWIFIGYDLIFFFFYSTPADKGNASSDWITFPDLLQWPNLKRSSFLNYYWFITRCCQNKPSQSESIFG